MESQPQPRPGHIGLFRRTNLIAGAVSLLVVLTAVFVPMPYAIEMPGPLSNVLGKTTIHDGSKSSIVDMIDIQDVTSYEAKGELDLTTVSVRGGPGYPVTLPELVTAWFNPNFSITPVENIFPRDLSRDQVKTENTAQMTQSQNQATLNAVDLLGIKYTTKVYIGGFTSNSPNKSKFKVGDQIISINGTPVVSSQQIVDVVKAQAPQTGLQMVVQRNGAALTVPVQTYTDEGVTRIGLSLNSDPQLPFKIKIRIEDVGGPSAGTMFALGIIDKLTPGELTKGQRIAGTGTQGLGGAVGPIGGIPQKMAAAKEAGVKYFLIPAGNCAEAAPKIPEGVTGVKITNLSDALNSVQIIASQKNLNALPKCS